MALLELTMSNLKAAMSKVTEDKQTLKAALEVFRTTEQGSDEYEQACATIYRTMTSGQRDMLSQLVKDGPVEDGSVIAKSYRDDLLEYELANRVVVKGEQGFTGANYGGWDVYRAGQKK